MLYGVAIPLGEKPSDLQGGRLLVGSSSYSSRTRRYGQQTSRAEPALLPGHFYGISLKRVIFRISSSLYSFLYRTIMFRASNPMR